MAPSSLHRRALCVVLAVYGSLLLVYSQNHAFTWDESYHLLAAQLILAGRRPYIDFCFPQSPLNAYWNAGLMRLFGVGWRVPHLSEALFVIASIFLMADYVYRRFPAVEWRFAASLATGLAIGLNSKVFLYGPVAQPYGICLFGLTLAFRISLLAVDRTNPLLAALVGLSACTAASSSLLTAAAAPVFLGWILWFNRAGRRWSKFAAFCAGGLIPFAPVLWLFALGPRQTWFNLIQYHLHYRKLYWPETTRHDIEILTSWADSAAPLILGLLALSGVLYVARGSDWSRAVRAEYYLCAALAAALALEVGRAHPTFAQYFLLIVPFVAVLASAGLYAVATRLLHDRPGTNPIWPAVFVSVLFAFSLGRAFYDDRESSDWALYRRRADQVDQVTPRNALLFAEEPIYFLTGRTPPPGFELFYTHKVSLPPRESALFHVIDNAEVKREVESGMFATAYSCDDDEILYYGLKSLYLHRVDAEGCSIFWGWNAPAHAPL